MLFKSIEGDVILIERDVFKNKFYILAFKDGVSYLDIIKDLNYKIHMCGFFDYVRTYYEALNKELTTDVFEKELTKKFGIEFRNGYVDLKSYKEINSLVKDVLEDPFEYCEGYENLSEATQFKIDMYSAGLNDLNPKDLYEQVYFISYSNI